MTPRRPWKPNRLRDLLIRIEKPMSRRPRRKQWKLSRQDTIVALGLINTTLVFTVASAAELELSLIVVKWLAWAGGLMLLWRGVLEERERKAEQERAREEARRLWKPREGRDAVHVSPEAQAAFQRRMETSAPLDQLTPPKEPSE